MKLDNRFKIIPFCCFSSKICKDYIGQKGYFSNYIDDFKYLYLCKCGILENVYEDEAQSFQMKEDGKTYKHFIPENFVLKEKKFRPFKDINEFFIKTNFEEGDLIHIRSKTSKTEYWLMLTGWTNGKIIMLGVDDFSLDNLFENFELWDGEENFIPFGVEEE